MQGALEETTKSFGEDIKDAFGGSGLSKQFFSIRRVSVPESTEEAKKRIPTNLEKFKFHYCAMASIFLFIYMLYCPPLIILAAILGLTAYVYRTKPTVFNVEIDSRSACIAGGVGVFVFFIFFKNVIVGLLAVTALSSILTLTHAVSLKETEEEEHDDEV